MTREKDFYLRSLGEQLFYNNLAYHIGRHQHLQQLSDKMMGAFLGLETHKFCAKKKGFEDFSAYELFRLSQIFQTSITNLIQFD